MADLDTRDANDCPFCGTEAPMLEEDIDGEGGYQHYVMCCRCVAFGPTADSPSEAVRLWNTRQPTSEA